MDAPEVWLVTGGGRGLGRAIVVAALERGHTVVATARAEHSLPAHERLTVRALDVRDRGATREAVRNVAEQFGRLDVLVNNAGYGLVGAVEEVSEEDARAILDTDLLGALWASQAAVEVMRPQGSGEIVQISTTGAVGAMPTLGLYNAAKWGLEGFSAAMAAEVARFGIRVTIVEPGSLDTDWAGSSMRFASPVPAYDEVRSELFGTAEVPWPAPDATAGTEAALDEPADSGGDAEADAASVTSPATAAAAILAHLADPSDTRLRLLVGDDAPGQVAAALEARLTDYRRDPRFPL
ncbi:SDR family NAD(P)-dependent oxidoreductase [Herbiconiux sp. CPCC 203407]|uniref:SDR family NAD(P)-dependent oxidoreductase n=1 Tax=Herbiconiux oxytropis TaxID=2970915 RepID=A0AA41XGF1_9MICO|nr:SDR family NAD(P)-dependent oxidoreductase [Herbiconiux oxytropis]MCS5724177.1 SDR family NAD(P)-dependent oxidoreductase [Herbiconiux oxytropis]MCS5725775.1 SDR family NAD(P)-dependent oxidoreductase [Herbiconiux oxytropis]